jgi:hypothetical protein
MFGGWERIGIDIPSVASPGTRSQSMALHHRASDDAPAPIADLELGLAVALLGVIILFATFLVPALA